METHEIAKQLFQNTEVRIFGTFEHPLFIANDVAEILDIKNVRTSIDQFEEYKKVSVRTTDAMGRLRETTALTEGGLYALILKSRKPIARDFEKWLMTEVIPSIRKTGQYNIQETDEKPHTEELERANAKIEILQAENIRLAGIHVPQIAYHEQDINDFTDKPCIYLISLTASDFKFGRTNSVEVRINTHFTYFRKLGLSPKIVKLWKCKTVKITHIVEDKIKRFARNNETLVKKYDQTEIIITDKIDFIVDKINKYVHKQNSREKNPLKPKLVENDGKRLDVEKLKWEFELKRFDVEKLKWEFELKRFDVEKLKWEFELKKLERGDQRPTPEMSTPQITAPVIPADQRVITDSNPPPQAIIVAPAIIPPAQGIVAVHPDDNIGELAIVQAAPKTLEQSITDWVTVNPPHDKEQSSIYFDRWKATTPHRITPGKFNKLVTAQGFQNVKQRGVQIWIRVA